MVAMDVARVTEVTALSKKSFASAITQAPLQYYVFPPNDPKGITAYYYVHDKATLNPQQPTAPPIETEKYQGGVGKSPWQKRSDAGRLR